MKGVDSGGVISARLIGLSAHQNRKEQILFFNADTRTVELGKPLVSLGSQNPRVRRV